MGMRKTLLNGAGSSSGACATTAARLFIGAFLLGGAVACGDDTPKPMNPVPSSTLDSGGGADAAPESDAAPVPSTTTTATGSAAPSADAASTTSPDTGVTPTDGAVSDASTTDAGDSGHSGHSGDAGGDAGGDGGVACLSNAASLDVDPCYEAFPGGCEVADGGVAGPPMIQRCEAYLGAYGRAIFDNGFACYSALELDECDPEAATKWAECFDGARAQACAVTVDECGDWATACDEMTETECNATVAPLVSDYLGAVTGYGCFALPGGEGCRAAFESCLFFNQF